MERDRPDLRRNRRSEADLLAGCDREQVEAITTAAAPLCVLASAGSGKTRVLTRRIAWRVLHGTATANHVLALTFTRKASTELRGRLSGLGLPEQVLAGTFHSVALGELRRLAAERRDRPPAVLSSKARLLLDVLDGPSKGASRSGRRPVGGAGTGGGGASGSRWSPAAKSVGELAQELEWAKARCLRPADYVAAARVSGRQCSWAPAHVAELWERYENEKRRRGVLDFEDLLTGCREQMLADAEFAASARWRFRHFFVDEYQDVNPAQQRLLDAWLGPGEDLCAVGDPHQAIYAWNGSNPRAIAEFGSDYPGATVLSLSTNYRSTNELLRVASAVLDTRPAPAGGPCPDGPVPTVSCFADEADEARSIAAAARLAKRPGRRWSQIAILTRTNAQLSVLHAALTEAGIPCRATSAAAFMASPWVRSALQEAAKARDAAALNTWAYDLVSELEPGAPDPAARPDEYERHHDLQSLERLAHEYLGEDAYPSGRGFCTWVEAALRRDDEPGRRDAVELTTFHRAKGLEWAVVFMAGLEDGYVPISHAADEAAVAEERRLLYVACTRAQEELHCSWAVERGFGEAKKRSRRLPSPWLAAIEAAHRDLIAAQEASAGSGRRTLAEARRTLGL